MLERTRLQKAGELSIFMSACLAGVLSVPAVVCVLGLSAFLMVVADRGQHRGLVERFPSQPKERILLLSIVSHLLLNCTALAGAYVLGWAMMRGLAAING